MVALGQIFPLEKAPIKTGKVVGMQKSYSESLANYIGPESCGISGNIDSEALTGVRAGWVLSREMKYISGADVLQDYGRQHCTRRYGKECADPAMMNECRESDSPIVSEKLSNKIRDNKRMAEVVEKMGLAEGNSVEQNRGRTQCRETLQSELACLSIAFFERYSNFCLDRRV